MSRIAVLMGGWSAEREVSLVSGAACAKALQDNGHDVDCIDVGRDLVERLKAFNPDIVFNALHGRFGEDGRIQGVLDLLSIPYTHSGVLASAVAMDKPMAIQLFRAAGIRCPQGVTGTFDEIVKNPPIEPPYVAKPAAEGSSVGVAIVMDIDDQTLIKRNDIDPTQRLLVEVYVPGRELTCAVLNGEALTVTEIAPKEGFYDYRAKYTDGFADHVLPADIPPELTALIRDWSERAHNVLGCRGVSRADFRWNVEEGLNGLHLLEVNTQPGMTPLSLVPEQAAHCGIGFADIVEKLVLEARCDP